MYNPNGNNFQNQPWFGGQTAQYIPAPPNYSQQPVRTLVGIPGRTIKNPSEIRPNEVSMDGSPSYFPTDDGNYIYAKQWNSDGTIRTVRYTRADETTQATEESVSKSILERLDKIEKLLSKKGKE
jgi:hypothetical protein